MSLKKWLIVITIGLLLFGLSPLFAEDSDVSGVANIVDPGEEGCLAVYLDLEDGQDVAGVRWFNNDGDAVFPQVRLVSGNPRDLVGNGDLIHAWRGVAGENSGWTELELPSVLPSGDIGCYVLFDFPVNENRDGRGQGTGPGIGYYSDREIARSFISRDQTDWIAIDETIRFAVDLLTVRANEKAMIEADSGDEKLPGFRTNLENLWPNPANPSVSVSFSLAKQGLVELSVYNVRGQRVRNLLSEQRSAGPHTVIWPGIDNFGNPVSSGVYMVKMVAGKESFTRQVTLLK